MVRLNRLLSPLLALLLLGGALLVLAEVVLAALSRAPLTGWAPVARRFRTTSWDDPVVLGAGAGLLTVGLVLLLLELKRLRPAAFRLAARTPGVTTGLDRSGLRRGLRATALGLDGITRVDAKVTRRRARVTARSNLRAPVGLQERLQEQVGQWYAELDLQRAPRLKVSLSRRGA